jgi:hypothetical protein
VFRSTSQPHAHNTSAHSCPNPYSGGGCRVAWRTATKPVWCGQCAGNKKSYSYHGVHSIGGDATPPRFEVSCWSNEITSSPPI